MNIRVKIYIDGELKKVFVDDLAEGQSINLCNTIVRHMCGEELADRGTWKTDIRWEVEVLK